jgi:hypothetical protein
LIIINVLPPEYRRRDIGINPITLSLAGAALVNFIVVLIWAYIALLSIPAAEVKKEEMISKKNVVQEKANQVDKIDGEIKDNRAIKQVLVDLLNKKVYWAKTINDFVGVLSNQSNALNSSGFEVSVESFKIAETKQEVARTTRGKAEADTSGRSFDFEWKPLIMTDKPEFMGENVRTFFSVFETSDFYLKHGFKDKPDKTYSGVNVNIEEDVAKSVAIFSLQWNRIVFSRNAEDVITKKLQEQAELQAQKELK